MRDIVIFEPTHIARESGTSVFGMQASRRELLAICNPLQADVGSAKEQRGHPPGYTGLKLILYTAMRGLF